ncbi:MAG: SAM-dependent chlorinase/fluorinase [Deltaproteobacteria bacterium]|uniref:SAM-dependent chlorinase/fluorinase n=1 Tax=Candidatus Zymogenus saltonus TaxID=2844893 RepID=A0A9D8KEU5_9DELT|nr:SAM-dependent chlorinase/fluorinase [Candidatus Zymogenus saltonus]
MPSPVITLTTDFGYKDPFVGVMKGVILNINRDAVIVDLNHGVAPQDLRGGAISILTSYRFFPAGTIHVVVVDPGVGTMRRPIAVKTADYIFVGPDNGVISWAMTDNAPYIVREIKNRDFMLDEISSTFHGRDIFSPTAARISLMGESGDWEIIGPNVADPILIRFPEPKTKATEIIGEIVYIDRFGNLITNIRPNIESEYIEVVIGDAYRIKVDGLSRSYEDGDGQGLILLVGSSGFLEIAKRGGSAERVVGAKMGERVKILYGSVG